MRNQTKLGMNAVRTSFGTVASALLLLGASPGWARSLTGDHDLSGAAGVASPSETLSAFENPAGLTYTAQTNVNVAAALPSGATSNPMIEGGLYLGNGNAGGAVGVIYPTATGASSSAFYGVAANLNSLHTSVGVNGSTMLSNGGGSAFNLGVIIGPYDKTGIGVSVMNFTNTGREFDGGLRFDATHEFSLLGDVSFDQNFGNPWLQPGVMVHAQSLSLTGSYGFALGSTNARSATNFTNGFSAGLGYRFSPKSAIKAYYAHVAQYYFELTLGL